MDEADPEMKELEEKQRSLSRVFDSLNTQASSVLTFTAQWKDLEDHFESTWKELRTRLEDLEQRVKLVAAVEAEAARVKSETEEKAKALREMAAAVEKTRQEVEEGERELSSVKLRIEECREDMRVGESECLRVDKLVKERTRKLKWVEIRVGEELKLVEEKRRELGECVRELELKEERLRLVESSIDKCDRIVGLKEELIGVMDMKVRDYAVLERSMEEWSCKLERKERELEGCVVKVEEKEEEVEAQIREINLVHDKFLGDVELRVKHLDELEESLLEREKELLSLQKCCKGSEFSGGGRGLQRFVDEYVMRIDSMSTEVLAILKESSDPGKLVLDAMEGFYPDNNMEVHFDLGVRRKGCCRLLKTLKKIAPQISPQVREEATKLAANWKAKMSMSSDNDLEVLGFLRLVTAYDLVSIYDAKELKMFLSCVCHRKQAAEIGQSLGIASPASLQSSVDPANLVLDWMQTTFSEYWKKGDGCLEETSIKTCFFVLEKLMRDLPHVKPDLKGDAMKFALQWKAKMRADAENAWEILGFLHFIAAYELVSTLDVDEIVKLLGMISQHKPAVIFCQTLPYTDKIPGEFIRYLVGKKQLVEAIRFIITFRINNITPIPLLFLLKEDVEEKMKCCRRDCKNEKSEDEKVKVVDQHIIYLRAVINLIKEYNLESEIPSSNVEMEICQLEKVKENWRKVQLKNVDKEQKRGTKRRSSTPPSKLEPGMKANKSHRTVATAPRPQPLQRHTPVYLQPNASPWLLHSRPFGANLNARMLPGPIYRPNLPPWTPLPNIGRAFFPF